MKDAPIDILSPKNDFVFKQLFGDKRNTAPLAAFLQAALDLPEEEFVDLVIEDPNLKRQHKSDKLSILDVRVTTRSGRDVDIEIQVRPSDELCDRIQCYVARMVAEKARVGKSYKGMPRSVCILIADHRLWMEDARRYHHRFRLYDSEAEMAYPNSMEIHTLELPKVPKKSDGTALWRWLKFISSKTRNEFETLAGKDAVMTEALLKLMDMSVDKATRRRAEARAKWLWDQYARLDQSRREGIAEGRLDVARRLLQKRFSLADIADATGLSESELANLSAEEP